MHYMFILYITHMLMKYIHIYIIFYLNMIEQLMPCLYACFTHFLFSRTHDCSQTYIRTYDSAAVWVSIVLRLVYMTLVFRLFAKKITFRRAKKTIHDCSINFVPLWLCNKVIEWECVNNCLCNKAGNCNNVLAKQLKSNNKLK